MVKLALCVGAMVAASGLGAGLALTAGQSATAKTSGNGTGHVASTADRSATPSPASSPATAPASTPGKASAPAPSGTATPVVAVAPVPASVAPPAPATGAAAGGQALSTTPAASDGSVSGSDGTLSVTLRATPASGAAGSPLSFVVDVTDSASTGPEGPMHLDFGDGQPAPATGLAATCHAGATPAPATSSFDYSHTYSAPGTYTVTLEVAAPCSSEQVTLSLPVTVTAAG